MRWRWNWHSRHHDYTDTYRSQIISELFVDIFFAMTEVRSKNARKHGRPLLDTWLKKKTDFWTAPSLWLVESEGHSRIRRFQAVHSGDTFHILCLLFSLLLQRAPKAGETVLFSLRLQKVILRKHKEYGPHKYWTSPNMGNMTKTR